MAGRNYVVEVKERQAGQPCFLIFVADKDIGLGDQTIMLDMKAGTDIEDAKTVARILKEFVETVSLTLP